MKGEVRYCTTEDGVRIAYCVEGEGPALIVCPQFGRSFSLFEIFLFSDRGEFVAKGFEEPVRISEVNWRASTQTA